MYKTPRLLLPLSGLNPLISWTIAILPTLAIIVFRSHLPAIAAQTPALFHYPAVFFASWAGGIVPGLLSTVILSAYSLFFFRPHLLAAPLADTPGLVRSLMFISTSLMFVLLVSALQRALKKVSRALESREQFLSNASHELRTPLAIMKLRLEVVKRQPTSTSKDFSVLNMQIDRLDRLITSMLNVSLNEEQQFSIHPETCDLRSLVCDVISSLETYAHSENSSITFLREQPLLGVWDKTKIEQVITNVLHNAIKYGNGGPILVELQSEGKLSLLTIHDSGFGVTGLNKEKLFLPYQRLENSAAVEGIGLGLYLSKKIVELHSGSISLGTSKLGGASFQITLPNTSSR